MLKIGDFSKLANVTVKALRLYAEMGLLPPAWIDLFTGYRYYALDQLPRLHRILAMKDLGLSLEQIQRVLDNPPSVEELRGMLHLKQSELQQKLSEEQQRLSRVEARLKQIELEANPALSAVVLRAVKPLLVACISAAAPAVDRLPEQRARARAQIEAWVEQAGIQPPGPWMLIYTGGEFLERDIPFELAVGLREMPRTPPPYSTGIVVRRLPRLEQAAVIAHTGPAEELLRAYAALYAWAEAGGYRVCGQAREVYWTDDDGGRAAAWDEDAPPPGAASAVEVLLPVSLITVSEQNKETIMEPEIIQHPAMRVAGTVYVGNNANQEIAKMWGEEFMPVEDKIKRVDPHVTYGVCEMDPRLPDGSFRYYAAAEIAAPQDAPAELAQTVIPAGSYAVFKHIGSLETLKDTYEYINQVWLPRSGRRRANRPDLEVYTEDFHDFQPDSVLYLWVPVE